MDKNPHRGLDPCWEQGRGDPPPRNGEWGGDGGGDVSGDENEEYAPRPRPAPLPSLVSPHLPLARRAPLQSFQKAS